MRAQSQPCSYHTALNHAEAMPRLLHWAEISLNRVKGPGELEAAISGAAAAAVRAIPSSVRTESPSSALRGDEENQAHGVPFRGRACLQHLFIGNAHRLGSVWRNCGFFPESWGTIMWVVSRNLFLNTLNTSLVGFFLFVCLLFQDLSTFIFCLKYINTRQKRLWQSRGTSCWHKNLKFQSESRPTLNGPLMFVGYTTECLTKAKMCWVSYISFRNPGRWFSGDCSAR